MSRGHFKPINSPRFLNDCHEYIFHFTPRGRTIIDRLALGVPYADKSNIARWSHTRGRDRRCRGNTWFIPYETIHASRERSPASGDISGGAGGELHSSAWREEDTRDARSISRDRKFRGRRATMRREKFHRFRNRRKLFRGSRAPNRGAKFVRLIRSERNSPSIAKRNRNCIPSRNIVEPAVWREMNSPAVPPANPDWFTVGDVDQLDFSKCKSRDRKLRARKCHRR